MPQAETANPEPELQKEPANEPTAHDSEPKTAEKKERDSRDYTLIDRAMDFNQLILELQEYASAEAVKEKNQMLIQQYVEEM